MRTDYLFNATLKNKFTNIKLYEYILSKKTLSIFKLKYDLLMVSFLLPAMTLFFHTIRSFILSPHLLFLLFSSSALPY